MPLPATENFNAAGAPGASWSATQVTFANGAARSSAGNAEGVAVWTADAFAADQYAQANYKGQFPMLLLRQNVASPSANFVAFSFDASGGDTDILKRVGGAFTLIQALGDTVAVDDLMRFEAEGTTFRAYKNAVQLGTDATDTSHATGSAGFLTWSNTDNIDNWEAGNLGGGGGGGSAPMFRGS